jgi:O-Antigen ligase
MSARVGGLSAVWAIVKQTALWTFEHRMLAVAHIAFLALIFFPDGDRISRTAGLPFLLLMAGLGLISPGRRSLTYSNVLLACAVYLLALLGASLADADASWAAIWREFRISTLILMFVAITGSLVSAFPSFPRWLFLGVGTIAALAAAANIYLFFEYLVPAEGVSLSEIRLLASIGMPEYANSTNISATYAVMLAGVVATLTAWPPLWQRALLMVDATVLGAGVLLTQARSAYVAMLMVFAVLLTTSARRYRYLALGTLAVACVVTFAFPVAREVVFARGESFRLEVWSKFADLIMQRPWLGYGPFDPTTIVVGDGYILDQAHNLVLSAWFRGGIAGAVAMAFIICGGIVWSHRHWTETGSPIPLAVMTAIATAGMFDYQLLVTYPTWPWPTFWLPFGLSIGAEMASRLRAQARLDRDPSPPELAGHRASIG